MIEFYVLAGINIALLFTWLGAAIERYCSK